MRNMLDRSCSNDSDSWDEYSAPPLQIIFNKNYITNTSPWSVEDSAIWEYKVNFWNCNPRNLCVICVSESDGEESTCKNPIFLGGNWVTIKAAICSESGKEYTFNGKKYYVAKDKEDIKKKIFIEGFPADRIVTSKITDMSYLFYQADFNQDISWWDVSKVTNMNWMFEEARWFDQSIWDWDVENLREYSGIFDNTENFSIALPRKLEGSFRYRY